MPCPNNPFAHTEGVGAVGIEVKWSCKKTAKGIKTSYYFGCGICKSQIFLNTWDEAWGFTLPQAEAMGMTLIDLNSTKKDALLKELGLQRAPLPGPPGVPPGFRPPPPPVPAGYRQTPPRKK
jgi:hypothetical protein